MSNSKNTITEMAKKAWNEMLDASAKAAVDYKKKVTAQQIAANADLVNYQRQMAREMPVLRFNPKQEEQLFFPEYRNQGIRIQLDHSQAERIFQHMLIQHTLDAQSRQELVNYLTPLVGIPVMMSPIHMAHRVVAESWILPVLAQLRDSDAPKISYVNLVSKQLYSGTNIEVALQYKLTPGYAKKLAESYQGSAQYLAETREKLKKIGLIISEVRAAGTYLDVFLRWKEE